ncbi:galactosylgalactosylxylosylprotein 3-beta-glucuronosyltransferase I-like [Gigantopelta aegis]|uniref:galactosylgalactosylxylosylprotein 3-beta-glucuronosyltransferase I-like n=1 Tax=Gigantopelta aegis TaxID=1735272 RepID=UPI001B888553|nr:galactosylgalactosylxylosylprotein 3-beta-glucuronosyltransferase I-like [Gigantopelta aegis]XP_041352908.1 galactosylgalactosylxylosylprotein 3-beta-glucuronosyltransferase I-like [Gigantopelta aegis]
MPRINPRNLFLLYASIFFLAFMFMIFNYGWCPGEHEQGLEKLLEKYRSRMDEKEQQIKDLKSELKLAKSKVTEMQLNSEIRGKNSHKFDKSIPVIYAITPTYHRLEQKADLTRLSHTFLHVTNLHWIVIEDSINKTTLVTNFLKRSGLTFTHLNVVTPTNYKLKATDPNWLKPRGVLQRNAGLAWVRKHLDPKIQPGVVFFADDDNTYDLQLFEEMRYTNTVSVWPVGLSGYLRYESPLVTKGKVKGWFTYWKSTRPFAMDMAGFSVNLRLFFEYPEARFSLQVQRGYQESTILSNMHLTLNDLEPRADNCRKVLVWHTRTEKTKLKNEEKMIKKYGHGSDLNIEV